MYVLECMCVCMCVCVCVCVYLRQSAGIDLEVARNPQAQPIDGASQLSIGLSSTFVAFVAPVFTRAPYAATKVARASAIRVRCALAATVVVRWGGHPLPLLLTCVGWPSTRIDFWWWCGGGGSYGFVPVAVVVVDVMVRVDDMIMKRK